VALAWVQGRPGVTSTIIGARRLAQLEDNVKALELVLSADQRSRLDALTQPVFGFPQNMQPMFPSIHHGGAMVNGVFAPPSPFVIEQGRQPY
ncbi:MAG: L-fuco-beta-pyranose dehydrogenase, partial [Nevskia sp.]|nr:L-fuco-beta-pyranose dehydrogenase [Nevskia sp.]